MRRRALLLRQRRFLAEGLLAEQRWALFLHLRPTGAYVRDLLGRGRHGGYRAPRGGAVAAFL